MTGNQRTVLKMAIDAAVRERIAAARGYSDEKYCGGCGTEHTNWTLDCDTCQGRHYRWTTEGRHPDPAFYTHVRRLKAAENERAASERSKRAARTRMANGGSMRPPVPSMETKRRHAAVIQAAIRGRAA